MHLPRGNVRLEKAEMCCTLFVWEAVRVVHNAAPGYKDNVIRYVLFILKRSRPKGNGEVALCKESPAHTK